MSCGVYQKHVARKRLLLAAGVSTAYLSNGDPTQAWRAGLLAMADLISLLCYAQISSLADGLETLVPGQAHSPRLGQCLVYS